MTFSDPKRNTDRGQSETLGVVLLIGISVVAAVAVAATGYAALDRDQERVGTEQAERALSQFDSRSSEVALGRAAGTRVDFGLPDTDGTMHVRPDAGWMRVRYTDLTAVRDPYTVTVTNVTLGAMVYQQEGRTVGYQGGGVFRSSGGGSVMLSRPEFHYRNGTLTVPIIQTGGDATGGDTVQVTPNGTERAYPDQSRNLTNKVDDTTVVVTVQSQYYGAWAEFFRQYTSGIVTVDHAAGTASVQFISLSGGDGVQGGVTATAESGELALEGTGAYVDAYDSAAGPYASTQASNGTVRSVGDVNMTGDSEINGDVEVGESIDMDGNSVVTGNVSWTESKDLDGTVEGNVTEIDGVPTVLPIDSLVLKRVSQLQTTNDNDEYDFVSGDGTEIEGTKEVRAGRYYTDHLTVDGGTLVVNTTGGNVTIGVEDWVSLPKGGEIQVEGNGTVTVYLNADETREENPTGEGKENVNFYVGKDSAVSIPDNRAPQLRIYAQQDVQGYIGGSSGNNATFNGLVYAPDGLDKDGDFYVKHANVYGGVVAGTVRLGQYGQVHYDQNLDDIPIPRASPVSRLEYLHVGVHRMNVTSR